MLFVVMYNMPTLNKIYLLTGTYLSHHTCTIHFDLVTQGSLKATPLRHWRIEGTYGTHLIQRGGGGRGRSTGCC